MPMQPTSVYELIRFHLPERQIPGDIETSVPTVLQQFLLAEGLQVSSLRFRGWPTRPWGEIAQEIHQQCLARDDHSANYVRRSASEMVSFNWLMVAPKSIVLQARMSRGSHDTMTVSQASSMSPNDLVCNEEVHTHSDSSCSQPQQQVRSRSYPHVCKSSFTHLSSTPGGSGGAIEST